MYLQHEGVKGMKWGVQNGPPYPLSDSTRKRMVRAQRRKDYADRELLSDKELQDRIKRLQMEKQYRELTNDVVGSGKNVLLSVLKFVGEKQLENVTQGAIAIAIGRGITALTGNRDLGFTVATGNYKDSEVKKR